MRLKDLASTLGLSPTTVSRALNGYPEVNEMTRQRVVEAASRFNYQPSDRARSLATGRAMAIGHIISRRSRYEIINPIFAEFVAGASEVYVREGYSLMMSVVEQDAEADVYRSLRARQSVDAFIVHSPSTHDDRLATLHDLKTPFVVHGRVGDSENDYSWVDVNNRRAFKEATDYLIHLGHRRIALVNGVEAFEFARRRHEGYRDALEEAGLAYDPSITIADEMIEENGYLAARQLLDHPDAPTAMLASSYIVAIGMRRAIEERGLKLGHDVSLITHDDDLSYIRNGATEPVITAMRSPVRDHGRICASMLMDLIQDPSQAPRHELLKAELLIGQSTGPAPQAHLSA